MMMMISFDPTNWFWVVGGDASRAWSSKAVAYVTEYPSGRAPFAPVVDVASEQELMDALTERGLPGPVVTQADYSNAVQSHVDAVAREKSYSDGAALLGYANSTVPQWAAEAATFIAWRDAVWLYVYTQLAAVQAAQREQPDIATLVAELPPIEWPVFD